MSMGTWRRHHACGAAVAIVGIAASFVAAPAAAQRYPDHPIKMIVPFTPGGPVDTVARVIAQSMGGALGQSVIVENRAGGGGVIGAKAVALAEPDGYTLLFGNISTLAVLPAVTRNRSYDPVRDFAAVAKVSESPEVLIIDPGLAARSVGEFVAYAKQHPGVMNYGSSGYGSAIHLTSEWFKAKTGTDMVHVPYKGMAEVATALLGGQVRLAFAAMEGTLALIRDGRARPLAVTSRQRSSLLPLLPTMIESGIEGFEVTSFEGVVAPAGAPAAVIMKLNAAINEGVASAEVRSRFATLGTEPSTGSPQDFAAFFAAENRKWAAVVATTGIVAE